MNNISSVKTIDRLVRVLESFSPQYSTWSLTELSDHLDLPKSTLHRFLAGLEFHGILRRDPADKLWRLGYRLAIWGRLAADSTGLIHIAKPVMERLADETGEAVILTVYQGREVVCIEKVETTHPVRLALSVGVRRPPHTGASSKVLMAYLPPDEIQAIIQESGLPKLCVNTITDPAALMVELARIRERGYADSFEETDPDSWGVATPIWDRAGTVAAAIGIAGPIFRFTEALAQTYVALCRQAA
ncbi:MAG TPA: IclR family transcriptional regulator, partial [Chloroflexi bacterium]|nr:IclR family transcriptional regulator [Chloroflexota bacterium]